MKSIAAEHSMEMMESGQIKNKNSTRQYSEEINHLRGTKRFFKYKQIQQRKLVNTSTCTYIGRKVWW